MGWHVGASKELQRKDGSIKPRSDGFEHALEHAVGSAMCGRWPYRYAIPTCAPFGRDVSLRMYPKRGARDEQELLST